MSRPITIVEVGPRDGLQNEKAVLEPIVRADLVRRLEAAGARRIEAVSFVHPKYVPQMAGAEEVMAALSHEAKRSRIGLVLNGKGYDRALGTAVDEVNVAMSATDGFGLKNQGLSVDLQVQMLADIVAGRANADGAAGGTPSLSATLSCVWGCPFDGEVSVDQVADLVSRVAALGVAEIALADTIGVGNPWAVTRMVEAARKAAPDATLRLHFHDTRNTGLANAHAGVEAGSGRAGRLGRRHRRLSLRAGSHRQYRHRGPGLYAGARGLLDRLRPRRPHRHRPLDRRKDRPTCSERAEPGRGLAELAFSPQPGRPPIGQVPSPARSSASPGHMS